MFRFAARSQFVKLQLVVQSKRPHIASNKPWYVKLTRIWRFRFSSNISEHQLLNLGSTLPTSFNSSFGIFEGVLPSQGRANSPETLAETCWSSAYPSVLSAIGLLHLYLNCLTIFGYLAWRFLLFYSVLIRMQCSNWRRCPFRVPL